MPTPIPPSGDTSDREIVISRVLSAPRELVWRAWTEPQHVAHWWGPRGFTTTTEKMELRVGGVWKHLMRGPDGRNYPNKSTFREIVPFERIVFTHGGGHEQGPGANFIATWTFESVEGGKTRLTGRMVFPTPEARDFVAREFGAVEGGRQTLERLSEYLPTLQSQPFVITRELAAPRDVVWRAWTEAEQLQRWFGPKGFTMTAAKMDFRPGGMFHYCLQAPDGRTLWGRFVYREIVAPERLVWVNSFSDPDGGVTRHPFSSEPWPLQMLTVVTFAENAGRTTVTVNWLPLDADDDERRVFAAKLPSMNEGWGGTFEQLTAYLAKP